MKRGFTLIEVLVTMAIVAILAGMMVPSVWKFWESQEIQTTKERLNALKLAMLGDKNLMQNGIRTSYGFVGDNGELPFANSSSSASLSYLVNRPATIYPHWNGPYMSGIDTATYAVDAWGRALQYTLYNNLDGYAGRHLSGEIRSAGLDGVFGNTDDIFVTLSSKEVAPTSRVQGNFVFSNLTGTVPQSADFTITFWDPVPASLFSVKSGCKTKGSLGFPNFTTIVRDVNTPIPMNLPIGKVSVKSRHYKNGNCAAPIFNSGEFDYFISDNLSSLLINLPVTVP
jgi:prepilin-type N-terminal cleavage/methylation domain-containing protein